ncbi:unnamed protein product [Didymodactylos carnosus]|uniref:long-chain-fatty-acid--CoA ligase n=1 Tax=Didymodactylos carnosus TaxID=1234261 RepID=A0A814FB40_9BILA|nr:unnamed protein product [Didymodactylos carnosus]CAF3753012.1 unnamed protein product [Didymodactylos carnosus]
MLQSFFKSRATYAISAVRAVPVTCANIRAYKTRIQRLYDDGIDLKQQSIEINPVEHTRRCAFYKDVDMWTFYKTTCPNVRTLGDALYEGYVVSEDGPCVGFFQPSNSTESLQWLSYSMVLERSRFIGSHLWTVTRLIPMQSKVAIISSNRPEYLFVEYACYMYGFITVSLYTSYDPATILSVLRRTQTEVLIVDSLERIQSFQNELLENEQIKEILVMDEVICDEKSKIRNIPSIFKTMKKADVRQRPTVDPDNIATFIMTSGTTGEPKIAMLSHENLLATAKGNAIRLERANLTRSVTIRHCSFLPMAHIYERFILLGILLRGTQVVFCPAPEKLVEYFSIVKPTQVSVVPRILNKIYDTVMAEVNKSKVKQFLVQQALRSEESWFLSRYIFRKVKKLFGGEVKAMITGAAPIAPDVMHFFRIALDIPIMEGYGQTESAGAGTSTHPADMSYGTIGSPVATVEIKFIDVPDTNYRSEMNQGEVCIRGPNIFKGYYDDEAKTRETIDEEGWLHTGDVGEWTSNGALRIIDRTKHIFKLNQGKYIAPERLEDVYIRSRWVAQIFIDGISSEATVVAIVIPDEEYVRKNFKSAAVATAFADLCQEEKLKAIILSDLIRLAKEYKFKYYETMSNIYLHDEPFSQKNGLLTVTLKTRRANARKHFQTIIKSLYNVGETATSNV